MKARESITAESTDTFLRRGEGVRRGVHLSICAREQEQHIAKVMVPIETPGSPAFLRRGSNVRGAAGEVDSCCALVLLLIAAQ